MLKNIVFYDKVLKIIGGYFYEREKEVYKLKSLTERKKNVHSTYDEFQVNIPQDRNSTFDPKIVKKRQKDISEIDQKIINMYARGLTTRQIAEQIEDIYDFECYENFISNVTD